MKDSSAPPNGTSLVIYESVLTRERVEMVWPPTDHILVDDLRDALRIPEWVDLSDTMVRQGVAGLWAERRATDPASSSSRPSSARLLGGVAFRLLCPSANSSTSFRRPLKDVDYLVGRRAAKHFVDRLQTMDSWAGTVYLHFLTNGDSQFNALRGGKRYRLHAATPRIAVPEIQSRVTDVFVDDLRFCHRLPVSSDSSSQLTLALPLLLLTKLQFIKQVPRATVQEDAEYRIVQVLDRHTVALGMEDKDVVDVAAAFLDAQDVSLIAAGLVEAIESTRDWGLWRTVSLNLRNVYGVAAVLKERGVDTNTIASISGRMIAAADAMLGSEPRRRPWERKRIWFDEVDDS